MSGNSHQRREKRRHAPEDITAEELAETEGPLDLDTDEGLQAVFLRGARRQHERKAFHAMLAAKLKKTTRKNRYFIAALGLIMGALIYLVFFTG